MVRLIFFILLASCAASAIDIKYFEVPRDVVEKRLKLAPGRNNQREPELRELFEKAACPEISEQPVKHVKAPNVICSAPGSTPSTIIVGAHFDFVDRGSGVLDNWSGASLLPSLLESLGSTPRRHRFVFIGFTGEEKGLLGSRFYVHELSPQQREQIRAMVNLDSLGASPTKFEQTRGDKVLINALAALAQNLELPLSIVNVHSVGMSDSDSFQDAKIPTILLHSITDQSWPILHTSRDQLAAMRLGDYYDSFKLIAAYLAYLDQILDPPTTISTWP